MPVNRWDKIEAGSCGLPLEGTLVRLINEEYGEGELVVYGPNVMNGYWGDKEASSEVFCLDSEGRRFLRTGDSFSIDCEGFLYFRHRIKNMIKVGGYAVSGIEIEKYLKSIDDIIDVRVIGIPDNVYGEIICACVYTEHENVRGKIEEISAQLPRHKQIKRIIMFDNPFPTNKNGKIDTTALQKQVG
jgi:acyl-CoA synthetase (AMP-forming)/AMP-acid ligase II